MPRGARLRMSIVSEVLTYQGANCQPLILFLEEEIIDKGSILPMTTQTIEKLKVEGEKFIAIVLAVNQSHYPVAGMKPLKEILKIMPRELWYVSWLTVAERPEAIVVHRGIERETLKELYQIYDRGSITDGWINAQKYGKLTHTIDIDFFIINPVKEWYTQTEQEGA